MAVTTYHADLQPWWPNVESLPARAELDYDPVTDSLLVAFDPTRPAEHFYLDVGDIGYVALRLALDTAEVVGIVIEDVNTVALDRHPSWKRLVEIAGTRSFKHADPADYPAIDAFVADVMSMAHA